MAAASFPYTDPAVVPLAIEQQSRLFSIPQELRDRIYELVFQGENRTSDAEVASSLLTCRQFYVEARVIAFSNINWRVNWDQVIRKYFDGKGILPSGEPLLDIIYFVHGIERLPDPELSTRPPLDFTLVDIISRTQMSNEQHEALRRMRRLTISGYWYDLPLTSGEVESGLLYHFLYGLSEFFVSDLQLDCLTFETIKPLEALESWRLADGAELAVTHQWKADLALIWAKRLTKAILLCHSADPAAEEIADYGDRPLGMDDEAWEHRLPYTNSYFIMRHKIGGKTGKVCFSEGPILYEYQLKDEFNFDSDENSRQWQWKFGKDEGFDFLDEDEFDYVEITHKNRG